MGWNIDRLVFHDRAIQGLLKSPEVQADLDRRARNIAAAAGEGYEVLRSPGRRARAVVITGTWAAKRAEAKRGNLRRAIDAGRG